jgi:hypothetical protein
VVSSFSSSVVSTPRPRPRAASSAKCGGEVIGLALVFAGSGHIRDLALYARGIGSRRQVILSAVKATQ